MTVPGLSKIGEVSAGGLSGATPAEAVSWGKIDPAKLDSTVIAYGDSTIGLPLLTAYALSRHARRKLKRLYDRREEMLEGLKNAYMTRGRVAGIQALRR